MATATAVKVNRGNQQAGQGTFSDMWLVSCTVDPGSLVNNATEIVAVAVLGVAVGDFVDMVAIGNPTAGFSAAGQVTGAGAVSIVLTNNTGGTVDLASSTWRFIVGRPVGF